MKYYIAKIFERNGEYEYNEVIRFKAKDTSKAEQYLELTVSTWYGEDADIRREDNGYYFNCGDVFTQTGDIKELSKNAYDELDSIITEMY